jgi:hypothetical protein
VARHVFIDETKQRNYLLVAAVLAVGDLDAARRTLRALVLPGQRRIHMAKEGMRRRRSLLSAIAELNVNATVYDGGRAAGREHVAREACLRAVVAEPSCCLAFRMRPPGRRQRGTIGGPLSST